MKVLYVTNENRLGGSGFALVELIEELKKNHNEIKPIVLLSSKNGKLFQKLKEDNVDTIIWKYTISISNNYLKLIFKRIFNILSAVIFSIVIRKHKIDIIHTNTSTVDFGSLLSKFTGKKHIQHIREFFEEVAKYNSNSLKFMERSSDKVFVISNNMYAHYNKYLVSNKLINVGDGLPFKEEINRYKSEDNKIFKVLIAGHISDFKGQIDAILAVAELVKKGILNIKLIIAGDGEKEYIDYLKKIIKEKKIEDNIEFLGYVINLKQVFNNIDLVLICSKKEGFGRVTVEAMMTGKAVIGTTGGTTKELIVEGISGMLYNYGDYLELAAKIEYLYKNIDKLNAMGENGYLLMKEKYTTEKVANKIVEEYNNLFGGK